MNEFGFDEWVTNRNLKTKPTGLFGSEQKPTGLFGSEQKPTELFDSEQKQARLFDSEQKPTGLFGSEQKPARLFDPETPDRSNPDFPQISGVFDSGCLIDATHLYGDAYPWLPEVLANAGCGRWKYSGFVVYDQSEFVTESGPKPSYEVINVDDKRIGEVWIGIVQVGTERRVREIEIINML